MTYTAGAGRRTLSPLRATVISVLVGVLVLGGSVFAANTTPSPERILSNVQAVAVQLPREMGFRQDVVLRTNVLLGGSFHADVTRHDDVIDVIVHDRPWFLSEDVSVSLLEVSEGLEQFDLALIDEISSNGDPIYVLEGTRRAGVTRGALEGKIWVNGRTWLVDKAELAYDWGNMAVEQTFQTENGYIVLREQRATADTTFLGLAVRADMTVQYQDYWFAND